MKPPILLVGLGETGLELARKLCMTWDIVAVDLRMMTKEGENPTLHGCGDLRFYQGDGTSALVLRRAGAEGAQVAVACTGSDEVNVEVLRIAGETLGVRKKIALMYGSDWTDAYFSEAVEVVNRDHACASILESIVQRGRRVIHEVGLGLGEVMEVDVLEGSAIVGRPLSELHPKRWLIGAVYRDNRLIVPNPDTLVRIGDRVMIIGEPEILPLIAALVGTGEAEFPLQYGSHVVTLCHGDAEQVLEETAYLIRETRANLFEVIACDADEDKLRTLADRCDEAGIPHEFSCTANGAMESLTHEALRRDVGIRSCPLSPCLCLPVWGSPGHGPPR